MAGGCHASSARRVEDRLRKPQTANAWVGSGHAAWQTDPNVTCFRTACSKDAPWTVSHTPCCWIPDPCKLLPQLSQRENRGMTLPKYLIQIAILGYPHSSKKAPTVH